MVKYYRMESIEKLVNRYLDNGGEIITLIEGSLGYGLTLLQGKGLKNIIISEVYVNEWSSTHKIRCYNKLPKKYLIKLENLN